MLRLAQDVKVVHLQEFQLTLVHGAVVDEIPGPHIVATRGRALVAGVGAITQSPLFYGVFVVL